MTWQRSMNLIKVLQFRLQLCFGKFTMLLGEESSQAGLFRHLSNHVFGVQDFTGTPRFYMSIRETFYNSIDLAVINEYDKGAVMKISTVLWHVYHVAWQRVLSNETF